MRPPLGDDTAESPTGVTMTLRAEIVRNDDGMPAIVALFDASTNNPVAMFGVGWTCELCGTWISSSQPHFHASNDVANPDNP